MLYLKKFGINVKKRSTPQNSVHSYMIDNMESQGSRGSGIGPDQLMSILISNPSTNLSNEDHKTLYLYILVNYLECFL